MAMNKFMHPRNPYRKRPDFKQLAIEFPEFRKYAKQDLSGKIQFNFKDQGAVWALTKCLLKRDFDLNVEILPDRLVPTLPLRLNYLLWIEDLISMYKPRKVYGIDIGTGASCIYPLLGAKHFSWNMLGTEIDISSIKCAMSNVENNYLSEKIQVKGVSEDVVLDGALDEDTIYDFCVCNPPFFSDSEELMMETHSRNEDRARPRNAPSGIPTELLTPGGELVFVARLITDSQALGTRVRIYSAMIGKKANLKHLKELVRECEGISSMATSVFCQGRTTRWGLAWTFLPGLDLNQAPHASTKRKALSFAPFLHLLPLTEERTLASLKEAILNILANLKIETDYEETDCAVMITLKAYENSWVNSRKKRRQKKLLEQKGETGSSRQAVDPASECGASDGLTSSGKRARPNEPGGENCSGKRAKEASDVPMPDQPASDVPMPDQPASDVPMPDLPASDVPMPDQPASNVPMPDQPASDVPMPDQPASDVPMPDQPASDVSMPDQPANDDPKPANGDVQANKKEQTNPIEYLVASLILKENDEATELAIEMYFIEGTGGKDSANQLLTCLKNRLQLSFKL